MWWWCCGWCCGRDGRGLAGSDATAGGGGDGSHSGDGFADAVCDGGGAAALGCMVR